MRCLLILFVITLMATIQSCDCLYKRGCPEMLVPVTTVNFYGFTRDELDSTVIKHYTTNPGSANAEDSVIILKDKLIEQQGVFSLPNGLYAGGDCTIYLKQFNRSYTISNNRVAKVVCSSCFGKKEYSYEPDGFDVNGVPQQDYNVKITK